MLNLGSYSLADDRCGEGVFGEQWLIAVHHSFERFSFRWEVSPGDLPGSSLSGCAGVCGVPRGQPQAVMAPHPAIAWVPRESWGLQPALQGLFMLGRKGAFWCCRKCWVPKIRHVRVAGGALNLLPVYFGICNWIIFTIYSRLWMSSKFLSSQIWSILKSAVLAGDHKQAVTMVSPCKAWLCDTDSGLLKCYILSFPINLTSLIDLYVTSSEPCILSTHWLYLFLYLD